MPVPAELVDEIAATVADVYREAEVSLVALLAKHLSGDLDRDMPAPQWVEEKLAAVRALRAGAQAVVTGLGAASEGAFRDAAAKAYRSGTNAAAAELPAAWFPKSGIGQAALEAQLTNLPGTGAVEALAVAVHKDVGERAQNVLRDVVDAYRSVITAAAARTVTGSQTRRQAAQAAWRRLTNKGISSFTDKAGRRWQLSSYVEMAARTVTQRAAVQGQTDRLAALDVRLVSVSDHGQECSRCRPFEGKILALSGPTGRVTVPHATKDGETVSVTVKATLEQARRDGFQHPNCRHSVSAYLPGVSKPPAKPTADPEGDQARQRQRALEREIRRRKLAVVGALDDRARQAAKREVTAAQAALREHLKAHPKLKRLPYREQIGAGNIPPKGTPGTGGIGPTTQPTLDGGPGSAPKPTPATPAEAVAVDENQLDLLRDVEPSAEPVNPFAKPKPKPTGVLAGDFTGLRRVGPQGGSNPGGLYEDEAGTRWYVKAQRSEQHARNEVAATSLYRAAGLDAPEVHLGRGTPDLPDGHHTASRIIEGDRVSGPDEIRKQVRDGFGVDAWLANWDVVGASFDNVLRTAKGGIARIDLGGSLLFRAQGGPKGTLFGDKVDEWLTLRDATRAPQAAMVFTGMTPVEQLAAVNRVNRVKVAQVKEIVAAAGLPDDVAKTLIKRRRDLTARLPVLREQAKRYRAWTKAHKTAVKGQKGLETPPLQLTYGGSQLTPRPPGWDAVRLQRVAGAIASYRGMGYTSINAWLRSGVGDQSSTVTAIDEAMQLSLLPKAVGVHRGITEPGRVFGAAWNDVDITGMEWTEKGYSSTTVDERVARSFSGSSSRPKVMMRIVLPVNQQALRLSNMAGPGQPLGGISTEAEVMAARGTRYRVVADHGVDSKGTRQVDVEVIT